jgi:hypothetical protein
VAVLVFLPRTAGAGVVAPDLGSGLGRLLRLRLRPRIGAQRLVVIGVLVLDVLYVGVRRGFLDISCERICTVNTTRVTSLRTWSSRPSNSSKASRLYSCFGFFCA